MVTFCRKICCGDSGGRMDKKDKSYQELFAELTNYERSGIRMQINGIPASPLQIVSAHMVREESVYMRDYIMDENGVIQELDFYKVNMEKEPEE